MPTAKVDLLSKIWYGRDPLEGFPVGSYPVDHHGWNSSHRYLTRAVDEVRPRVIIEIGVWKGGSVLTMAQHLKDRGIDGAVIAIDTWLGSSEHWTSKDHHEGMGYAFGYPHLYHCFVANVFDRGLQDYVVPMPLDSINAHDVLARLGVRPDVLHIDAGHDYRSVTNDLDAWWHVLAPGGVLVGDDYFTDRPIFPEVREAFDDFFAETKADLFENADAKCYVRKPRA